MYKKNFSQSKGGKRFGGGSEKREMVMHKAICSNCHKPCEVPFRPTGSKPVYCRDCFNEMGGASNTNRPEQPRRNDRAENRHENRDDNLNELKKQLELVNSKLETLIRIAERVPEKISPEKTLKKKVIKK